LPRTHDSFLPARAELGDDGTEQRELAEHRADQPGVHQDDEQTGQAAGSLVEGIVGSPKSVGMFAASNQAAPPRHVAASSHSA
jgi:hypothetical protein